MKVIINGCSHSTGDFFYKELIARGSSLIRKTWWNFLYKSFNMKYENVHQISYFLPKHSPQTIPERNISSPYGILNTSEMVLKYLPSDIEKYMFDDNFLISFALDGKGNDTIFLETFDVLRKMEKNKIDLDFVIIQWSSPVRKLVSDGSNYLFSNPHENYQYGLNFEPSGSLLTLNYMIILQEYLKQKNIKYIFLNYFPLDKQIENSFLYNQLDLTKIVSFDDDLHPIFDGWITNIISNNLHGDRFGHPSMKGYNYISNKIIDKINKEYNFNFKEINNII